MCSRILILGSSKSFQCQSICIYLHIFWKLILCGTSIWYHLSQSISTLYFVTLGCFATYIAYHRSMVIIAGDLNIHMDEKTDTKSSQLPSLIDSFGLVQHVSGSTYTKGHTLDLVISRAEDDIIQGCTVGSFISDHIPHNAIQKFSEINKLCYSGLVGKICRRNSH